MMPPEHSGALKHVNIYLGTQGWSYRDWVGSFYPTGTNAGEYLVRYAEQFDAVELDTTFYGTPAPNRVDVWRRSTPEGFQFTAKVPRSITHDRHLVDAEEEFDEFLTVIDRLGPKLGPILIQLPPDFTYHEMPAVDAFIRRLPKTMRFAAEFRHRSWLRDETYELLREANVAFTMIDLPYMPVTLEVTTDFTYCRLLGDHRAIVKMHERQLDKSRELQTWSEELNRIAGKIERAYAFVNNHYSGHSPADVRVLRQNLGLPATDSHAPQQGVLL